MALFDKNRFRALASAFMLSAVLTGCGGGGGAPAPNPTFTSGTQNQAQITNLLSAGGGNDAVDIAGDTVSDIGGGETGLAFEGFLDGLGGDDEVRLVRNGRVASIVFSDQMPTSGELHLQRYEIITIIGGMVDGTIDASAATTGITFNLVSGTAGGDIMGSGQNDVFIIAGDITGDNPALDINGLVQAGGGDQDEIQLNAGAVVNNVSFSRFVEGGGGVHLQDVETITVNGGEITNLLLTDVATTGITFNLRSGTINSDGSVGGGVAGSNQDDIFNLRGTITINGNLTGGDGTNTFNLESGTITGNVNGGAGVDSFVIGAGITIGGMIDGGADADTLSLATGFTPTAANLFGGVLTLTLNGGGSLALTLANIATENINVGTLTLTTMMLPAPGDGMMPVVPSRTTLMGTSGANTPALDSSFNSGDSDYNYDALGGDDVITISAPVDGNVLGGAGMDTITLSSGGMVGGYIDGGGDTDTFTATAAVNVRVTTDDTDTTANTIRLRNVENITLSGGNDTLELLSGSVTGAINTGGGNDQLTVTGGVTFGGTIDGGAGTGDRFVWGDGLTATVVTRTGGTLTLAGNDDVPDPTNFEIFVLDGGTIRSYTGDVNAIDQIELLSGMVTENVSGVAGNDTFTLSGGTVGGDIDGGAGNDTFTFSGNITGGSPALDINGLVQGGSGDQDEVRLVAGGVVISIAFGNFLAGELNLRTVEVITIDGGTINIVIQAAGNSISGLTFNLISGTINSSMDSGGGVGGTPNDDIFNLYSGITINGILVGGGGTDVLRYAGAPSGTTFTARGGLAGDTDITDGSGSVRGINRQEADANITSLGTGGGLRGLTVSGIEVLGLSPALNLYGAMSDALMQFGAQTAQGFALADLDLSTGRATSLVSKNSPYTKGRIWAHKITHSGNGKGSIGLNLTGLTARADSDYDYEMSLTQHGFDAPLAATKLGAFNLRAVSHTMTGTIETNVAEAQVSGYGAGLALLWRGGAAASKASASATRVGAHHHGLSAHITSLAGAYEVEAHTSPLNPRAVVNEVSEGSFSAINAVVSAGVADTRKLGHSLVLRTTADIVWQTLSLDDFTETGSGGSAAHGIIINFDKATRFTARVGAGLEGEHWFSDVVFVHETSSGGTLSSGLSQDYKQDDGTAIEMKLGGKLADLATGLTLKAYAGLRTSLISSDSIDPSAHLALNWRF